MKKVKTLIDVYDSDEVELLIPKDTIVSIAEDSEGLFDDDTLLVSYNGQRIALGAEECMEVKNTKNV